MRTGAAGRMAMDPLPMMRVSCRRRRANSLLPALSVAARAAMVEESDSLRGVTDVRGRAPADAPVRRRRFNAAAPAAHASRGADRAVAADDRRGAARPPARTPPARRTPVRWTLDRRRDQRPHA